MTLLRAGIFLLITTAVSERGEIAGPRSQMRRIHFILLFLILAAAVPAVAAFGLVALARSDVEQQESCRATLVRVRPSLNCLFWLEFWVEGSPVYAGAYWRLVPWRDVSYSK